MAGTFSIYRSSAGSGKTHRLAVEFISLAIKDPGVVNKILAVTFTNKATKEMKERILEFLLKLATKKDDDLLLHMKEMTSLDDGEIAKKAKLVMGKILHQYSQFSISTIDAFFQKIVKSFAKELGLLGNYKVELDQDKIKLEVIDKLIEELGGDRVLTNWLVDFSLAKVDENKSWDIRPQIETLTNEVFKESFRPIEKELQQKGNADFKRHLELVSKLKAQFEQEMKTRAIKALDLIASHGLSIDDFSRKSSGPAGYFNRILTKKEYDPKKLVEQVCEDPQKWATKTSAKKNEIAQLVEGGLQEVTISLVEYYWTHYGEYVTAVEIQRNFYVFGILSQIITKLTAYRQEHDLMMISDVAVFLKEIIAENETPFIYEKTGSWFRHYLIDEFQDTSGYQWQNFKPLVENGLAQDQKSLLVGDGKQSIYRWRGGDWNLLLNQVGKDLARYNPQMDALKTNWRSDRKIIEFNNELFSYLPSLIHNEFKNRIDPLTLPEVEKDMLRSMAADVERLYEDVKQDVAHKNLEPSRGRVDIVSFQKDGENSFSTKKERQNRVLDGLPMVVEQLHDAGFPLRDIAVLVRKSDEGKQVIEKLLTYKNSGQAKPGYGYDAISGESLFLGNASAIRLLINAMKYCLKREDKIAFAELCYAFQHLPGKAGLQANQDDLQYILVGDMLPKGFIAELDSLIRLPVYEMIERLIQIFELGHEQNKGYLQAFQDLVLEYFSGESKDIHDFLAWWEDKGKRKSIQIPEAVDAIRVLTIHKSKGLEFKAVLLPFCDWKLDHDTGMDNFIWCKTDQQPFADIGYVPLKYSKRLEQSCFAPDYFEEMIKAHIDNLNLLYVALTRAEKYLWICCPPSTGLKSVGDLALQGIDYLHQNQPQTVMIEDNNITRKYTIGSLELMASDVDSQEQASHGSIYRSADWKNKIAIRKKGGILSDDEALDKKAKINFGILVHEILSKITSEKEAGKMVAQYQLDGLLSTQDRETITEQLHQIFANPQVQGWFNTDWQIKTEVPIIVKGDHPKRPDRVLLKGKNAIIIDFKTGAEKASDKKQVLEYQRLLKEMGYLHIEAYLLYIAKNKVIAID